MAFIEPDQSVKIVLLFRTLTRAEQGDERSVPVKGLIAEFFLHVHEPHELFKILYISFFEALEILVLILGNYNIAVFVRCDVHYYASSKISCDSSLQHLNYDLCVL